MLGQSPQGLYQLPVPHPLLKSTMAGLERWILFWQFPPLRSRAQHPQHAMQHGAGVVPRTATLVGPPDTTPEKIELSQDHSTLVKGTEKAGLYTLRDIPQERVYAVNLASRTESDNAARHALKVGDITFESTRSAIEAKREIWRDLAWIAGALLLLEWWVFHRRVGM